MNNILVEILSGRGSSQLKENILGYGVTAKMDTLSFYLPKSMWQKSSHVFYSYGKGVEEGEEGKKAKKKHSSNSFNICYEYIFLFLYVYKWWEKDKNAFLEHIFSVQKSS